MAYTHDDTDLLLHVQRKMHKKVISPLKMKFSPLKMHVKGTCAAKISSDNSKKWS